MATILHVDMDAFFAAIELRRRPELEGRPVIVGGQGDPTRRGVVSTATYEARRYGIHSGMALAIAFERCPQAVFLPVDFPVYARVSRRVMAVLHRFSRRVEEAGLDEAYLELSPSAGPPQQVARAIQEAVRAATGLTCSVGAAPNKLLAKIASDLEKPDGLTVLTFDDVPTRVWPLPARRIPGVGPKTEERLAKLGIRTIGDLAAVREPWLAARFGESHGRHLYQAARGIDDTPVQPHRRRKSVGHETTFQRDIADPAALREALGELARRTVGRLRRYHYRARTVTVKVRFADFVTLTRARTLPAPSDRVEDIAAAARDCLARAAPDRPVRLLGVRLTGLTAHPPGKAEAAP